jgi:hypothetical protein
MTSLLFLFLYQLSLVSSFDSQLKYLETIDSTKNGNSVTVSGISSGAYMAVQFHIAYSSIVNGTAAFAGSKS